ncbi:MAG: hypothetical protein JM58_14300 [Peptococcaceae bacterium BICA1-8]|nr:MAG: hypothetical protein JM58_14300 [Peptococcaceae bacterium BICA1-8]
MKKVKVLAITMVMALMVMGMGYAYWSDDTQLVATVDAGEFDVQFLENLVGETIFEVEWDLANTFSGQQVAHDEANFTITTEDITLDANDKATVTFDNLYPGAKGNLYYKVANFGTIPAEIEALTVAASANGAPADFSDHFYAGLEYSVDGVNYTNVSGAVGTMVQVDTLSADILAHAALFGVQLDAHDYSVNVATRAEANENPLYFRIPFELKDDLGGVDQIGAEEFENGSILLTVNTTYRQWNI